jgi:hypothetical protein
MKPAVELRRTQEGTRGYAMSLANRAALVKAG